MTHSSDSQAQQTKISTPAQDRKTCWSARDQFLSCLKNSFTSEQFYLALKESTETETEIVPKMLRKSCDQFRDLMYLSCPNSWVIKHYIISTYFFYCYRYVHYYYDYWYMLNYYFITG